MADNFLSILTNKPGATEVVLVNAQPSTTGYFLKRGGIDLGAASFDKLYSGARGTLGAVLAGEVAQNRVWGFVLEAVGTSENDLQSKLSVLWDLDEELRRFGGVAYWRAQGSTYKVLLRVLDSAVAISSYDPDLWVTNHRLDVTLGLTGPPYAELPCMDSADRFTVDSITRGDYTFQAGAGEVTVVAGQLTGSNLSNEKRLVRTTDAYSLDDHQVTIQAIPGSIISGFKTGVLLKWQTGSPEVYLEVYVDDNGTNSRLRIDKVVNGARTNLATTNLAIRVAAATPLWVRGRLEGATVFAEHFSGNPADSPTSPPSPMAAPTTAVNFQLTASESQFLPDVTTGQAGFSWVPKDAAAVLDDFVVEPYTYRNLSTPLSIRPSGVIPGDAPALVEALVTSSGGANPPVWAGIGWWTQLPPWNRVWNGDFDSSYLGNHGWGVAAVTNINGAATSISRITSAHRFGVACGQIVCPATSGVGASFRIFRRFRKGITYSAECWIHAGSSSTSVSLRIGNSSANDKATSGGVGLTALWQKLTVTWTPAADYDEAHLAVIIGSATSTTFEIDGVSFYEGAVAPTSMNQTEGRGGFPPLGILEAENSQAGLSGNINYRLANGSNGTATIVVDPSLCTPDDYAANTISVEVWGRLDVSTAVTCVLSAIPISNTVLPSIYSEEFGSVGKALVIPSSGTIQRFVRLGTLRFPTDGGRYLLKCNPGFDYFLLLPSNARAISPTGLARDSSYPSFATDVTEITRRIRSDLSGTLLETLAGAQESAAPGLGGQLLEVPSSALEWVLKLSSLVPDDPTSDTTTEQLAHAATFHVKITPRVRLGRSS